jgi:hypothetical protein
VGPDAAKLPVVVIEPSARLSKEAWLAMVEELRTLARTNPRTRAISTFIRRKGFPVDKRHNAKINRECLAAWAAGALARRPPGEAGR